MEHRIEEYTVSELARLSGVSVRTLHHYDAIGLLKPAHVAENGYRIYRHPEALRLQEILFYREAGIALRDIKDLLAGSDPLQRLIAHRKKLVQNLSKQAEIIASLDRTISHLSGAEPMTIESLYTPFSPEKQEEYETWLIDTYGPDMAKAIKRSQKTPYTKEDRNEQMNKLRGIEAQLVDAYRAGVSVDAIDLKRHQDWVSEMWGSECSAEAYAGLAQLYLSHPDFIARYETLSQGFSQWLTDAMVAYSKRQ